MCGGSGGADGAKEVECRDCRGQGVKTMLRQLAPGMVQQMQAPCGACRGQGSILPEGKRCKGCDGKKVVAERKILEVHITKGAISGTKIVMRGEAGDAPGVEAGDVIFVIKVEEHSRFQRVHHHLLIEKDIPLVDALTGASFTVKHLDGRSLLIKTGANTVIQPGSYMAVANAGMPLGTNHYRFGDLLVRFNVIFPPAASIASSAAQLKKLLPRELDPSAKREAAVKRRAAFKARASGKDEDDEEAGDDGPLDDEDFGEDSKGAAAAKGEGDEECVLVPCNIQSKISEAQAQQQDDKRCVARRGKRCRESSSRVSPPPPFSLLDNSPEPALPPTTRTKMAAAGGEACSARNSRRNNHMRNRPKGLPSSVP